MAQAAKGADGRTWFSQFGSPAGDGVAAVTTAGVVTHYSTGVGSQPNAIILGPDGNIWVGGYGPGIYKVTTAGVVTPYALAGSHIVEFAIGTDGNIWFGDYGNNAIGKITTTGTITSYPLPAGGSPCGLATGGDGNLWLADCGNGAVDQYSTAGALLHTYSTGLSSKGIGYIVGAPDGNLYMSEYNDQVAVNDHIVKVSTSGVLTEMSVAPLTYPDNLAVGKDGNVYFTEYDKSNLGRVTLATGTIAQFPLVLTAGDVGTEAIANGSDNRLWLGGSSAIYALTY
jgi:virginiamycin B lyase